MVMANLGVTTFSPTLLPLFPPPGVTAQVHWVLAGTLLSGKCAAVYLVHLHPLICGHIRCEENLCDTCLFFCFQRGSV